MKARVEHDAVVRFFAEKDKGKLDLGLNQALENILSNEAWLLVCDAFGGASGVLTYLPN